MTKQYDVIIIGAGAIGCAAARELSRYSIRTAVLEKNSDAAGETSGRNSAVVHAGFNNRPGSLMAELCVAGNEGFAGACKELDVPFRKTGKLVLAFDRNDEKTLEKLLADGQKNGCRDLRVLSRAEAEKAVPAAAALQAGSWTSALWSPHTGITNPFLYCIALAENAAANGTRFYLNTEVSGISRGTGDSAFRIFTGSGKEFSARILINCAGLFADRISAMAGADRYTLHPCRGEYFILDKNELAMPVYPAPRKGEGGLGVHLTPTIEGNIIIGPSAEYLETGWSAESTRGACGSSGASATCGSSVASGAFGSDPEGIRTDYACTREVMDQLMKEAVQLMPGIARMQPIGNYAGIRPKLTSPEEGGYSDFVIRAEEDVPGLINLIGIESPGLTASLPIARMVCRLTEEALGGLSEKPDFQPLHKGILRFREQSPERQAQLIAEDPEYGEIVCRCQQITKREIRQAIENPLGARSISAVKYRAWATTGRCNGGYCLPKIVEILIREYGMKPEEILYRNEGSGMFSGWVK